MWIQNIIHTKVRGVPLWIICACGLAGVLVDFDHVIAYWTTGQATRMGHPVIAIISVVILCVIGAYFGGLYIKLVLKKKRSFLDDKVRNINKRK